MARSHVVCAGLISDEAAEILTAHGPMVHPDDLSEATVLPLMPDALAIVVGGGGIVTRAMLEAAPDLRVIGRSGVGYNNIDINAATDHGVPVIVTPGAGSDAVAEAALALVLALTKNIFHWDRQIKAGNWKSRAEFRNLELLDQTLGIIGLGTIGQALARCAAGFQMKLVAHDPFVDPAIAESLGVELVELEYLLANARIICLHALVTDQTRGMINAESLKHCQPGTYLVNLARGDLIDGLDCLHDAILDGTLAGVGLDVFDPEPPDVTHPIFRLEQCVCAPHALAMNQATMDRIFLHMATGMDAVLRGQRPKHVVNPSVLDA